MQSQSAFILRGDTLSALIGTTPVAFTFPDEGHIGIRVFNAGPTPLFVHVHPTENASAATSCPIAPGAVEIIGVYRESRISAVRESGSAMGYFTRGWGL